MLSFGQFFDKYKKLRTNVKREYAYKKYIKGLSFGKLLDKFSLGYENEIFQIEVGNDSSIFNQNKLQQLRDTDKKFLELELYFSGVRRDSNTAALFESFLEILKTKHFTAVHLQFSRHRRRTFDSDVHRILQSIDMDSCRALYIYGANFDDSEMMNTIFNTSVLQELILDKCIFRGSSVFNSFCDNVENNNTLLELKPTVPLLGNYPGDFKFIENENEEIIGNLESRLLNIIKNHRSIQEFTCRFNIIDKNKFKIIKDTIVENRLLRKFDVGGDLYYNPTTALTELLDCLVRNQTLEIFNFHNFHLGGYISVLNDPEYLERTVKERLLTLRSSDYKLYKLTFINLYITLQNKFDELVRWNRVLDTDTRMLRSSIDALSNSSNSSNSSQIARNDDDILRLSRYVSNTFEGAKDIDIQFIND